MNIKYNNVFKELTGGNLPKRNKLSNTFDFIQKEEIIIIDDCYYFKSFAPKSNIFSKDFIDKTGNECFFNKILIDSYFKKNITSSEGFKAGVSIALILSKRLKDLFNKTFSVILSFDGENTTIRFHKIRPNENWLSENLNAYKGEAILHLIN